MDASTSRTRELPRRSQAAVLPKINVQPVVGEAAAVGQKKPYAWSEGAAAPRRRADWDVKFALALILLVVLVNASLTLLFGGEAERTTEGGVALLEKTAALTPGDGGAAAGTALGALAPAAGDLRETRVFISREDKRVLLRQLNAAPASQPRKSAAEPGTYRSVGQGEALSIIGAGSHSPQETEQQQHLQ